MMRLLVLLVVATLAWSVYWAIGSTAASKGFETWFAARQNEGWVAGYDELDVTGFPSRFESTFTEVEVADPETGLAWRAPLFQLFALSYQPNHLIAVRPKSQRLATPIDKYDIASEDMRASFISAASTSLAVKSMTLTSSAIAVTPESSGQPSTADKLTLAASRLEESESTYRLGLSADGFSPALDWRVLLDPSGSLPDRFDALTADAVVEFDKPWDRSAIEDNRPQPKHIDLALVEARWGRLELQIAGEVDVSDAGVPDGEIVIKARNWREILKLGVESGALPEALASSVEGGLSLLSQLAGNPKTLDIPLVFKGGKVLLGPVPIADAPVLLIR